LVQKKKKEKTPEGSSDRIRERTSAADVFGCGQGNPRAKDTKNWGWGSSKPDLELTPQAIESFNGGQTSTERSARTLTSGKETLEIRFGYLGQTRI